MVVEVIDGADPGPSGIAPHVSLRPLAAAWMAQHPQIRRELRQAAERQRLAGRRALAEQLEEAAEQLRHALISRRSSADGNAEEVDTEIEPGLEVSSSWDSTRVAGMLGVTESRVRQLVRSEVLSATRVAGRWAIDRQSVDEYLLSRSTT